MKTKRLLSLAMVVMFTMIAYAQKDVTTFLGIPVDGTKAEMKKKLIEKGFVAKITDGEEYLEGKFNGASVNIYISTNRNKVWRVVVEEPCTFDENQIKIRYNTLLRQFQNNSHYLPVGYSPIPEDERIGYEIKYNKKTYNTIFYQRPDYDKIMRDAPEPDEFQNKVIQELMKKYTLEQLQDPTEEMLQDYNHAKDVVMKSIFLNKCVWFRILASLEGYYIVIFYDNKYNQPNGEDL